MTTSITKRTQVARKIMTELRDWDKVNDTIYWRRAEAIWKLKHENLWKYVYGEDEGNWATFCTHELKVPVSTADQKAAVYEFFVRKHGFSFDAMAPYDSHLLYYVTRYAAEKPKKKIEELLEQSTTIGRSEFLAELRGDDCYHKHTHEEEEKKVVCDDCKRTLRKKAKK